MIIPKQKQEECHLLIKMQYNQNGQENINTILLLEQRGNDMRRQYQ